jgi:hypothetical protein
MTVTQQWTDGCMELPALAGAVYGSVYRAAQQGRFTRRTAVRHGRTMTEVGLMHARQTGVTCNEIYRRCVAYR